MEWYYAIGDEQLGPVTEEQLVNMLQSGQLASEDLVWNHTMGDEWVTAGAVDALFPAQSAAPEDAGDSLVHVPGLPGPTHNRDLIQAAKQAMTGNWGLGAGLTLLYQGLVYAISSFVPIVGSFAVMAISGHLATGYALVCLKFSRGEKAGIEDLFRGFNRFGTILAAYLLVTLYTVLWTLLFIIPGIIAAYSYSMTYMVLADDPTAGASEAIARSKAMMVGNKWKLFCLFFRFFGWALLCILTLGIGYFWVGPWMQTASAKFYDDIRGASSPILLAEPVAAPIADSVSDEPDLA